MDAGARAVLKRCLATTGPPRRCFSATVDSPVADFVAEAAAHPVLALSRA